MLVSMGPHHLLPRKDPQGRRLDFFVAPRRVGFSVKWGVSQSGLRFVFLGFFGEPLFWA